MSLFAWHTAARSTALPPLTTRDRWTRRGVAAIAALGAVISIGLAAEPASAAPISAAPAPVPLASGGLRAAAAADPPVSGVGVDSPTCTYGTTAADNWCKNIYSFPSEASNYTGTASLYNAVILWHWNGSKWVQFNSSAYWSTYTYRIGARLYYIRWGGVQGRQTVFSYPSRAGYWQFTWTTYWVNNRGATITSLPGNSPLFYN